MTNILAIAPNVPKVASFSSTDQLRNVNISAIEIDNDRKNKFFHPAENAIVACMPQASGLDIAGIYALPESKPNRITNGQFEKLDNFFPALKNDVKAGLKKLPDDLQNRLRQQLSAASMTLVDRKITVTDENIAHRKLEKNCIEEFLTLSENVSRAEFTGTDEISNIGLSARTDALTSALGRLQDHRGVTEIARDFADTLAILTHLSKSLTSAQPSASDNALLISTLRELGRSLIAMQDMKQSPDLYQLMLIDADFSRFNVGVLHPGGKIDPAVSQIYMEVQRIVAWTKLQVVARQADVNHSEEEQSISVQDCLSDAMAIEVGIVAAATATLRGAQDKTLELDALTEVGLKAKLMHFLQVHERFNVTMQNNPTLNLVGKKINPEDAARQLDAWCKGADIGAEIMRMFIDVLIRMREGMRESRQFALTLYSQHAAAAIVALKQQADDTWKKEMFSAVGLIASGALQLVPLTLSSIKDRRAANVGKNTLAADVKIAPAKAAQANKNMQSMLEDGAVPAGTGKMRRGSEIEGSKNTAAPANSPAEEPASTDARAASKRDIENSMTRTHEKMNKLQLKMNYYRAIGELAQGAFGIAAAYYGCYAAYDGVRHFSENAEMQKQLFQRDRWGQELETKTHDIDQVSSIITDLQTRQTETTKRLIG
jgi:hypothetical protein